MAREQGGFLGESRMCNKITLGVGLCLATLFLIASSSFADRVKMKDGRVIEGVVIPQGTGYWVKGADGMTYKLDGADVESVVKGSGAPTTPGAPASTPAAVAPGAVTPGTVKAGAKPTVLLSFVATKSKCSTVDTALAAVTLWQQFVDNAPATSPDLPAAKEELGKWKQLADTSAEKIKGKWIGGDERKQILAKARALQKEADELITQNQTLAAVKKLEESAAIYPNSFETIFSLGYIAMLQHSEDKAMDWFNKALVLQPETPEAMGNIAIIYCTKRNFDKGILLMKKALEIGDRKEIVHNLVTAITLAPDALRRRKDIQEAEQAARLLAGKYDLTGAGDHYLIVPLRKKGGVRGNGGSMWSGTGFLLSPDGLILTNRHVVEGGKTLMVVMQGAGPGGTDIQRSAEVVVIDDMQDLALIRIKPEAGKPYIPITLSPKDSPADGADCTVVGYPMIDRLGGNVKITRGIVSSAAKQSEGPDVMVDAKVNPGNSGGPIVDRFGNVMAIVSMKTIGNEKEDSYGLGISAGMIRRFLVKNDVNLVAGVSTGAALSAEEIAAKVKPSTVCILGTNK